MLGASLIFIGLNWHSNNYKQKLLKEEKIITAKKEELKNKIKPVEDEIKKLKRVTYLDNKEAYYDAEDKKEELEKSIEKDKNNIEQIEKALSDTDCSFVEDNSYTSNYCSLKRKIYGNYDILLYIIGSFIIFTSIGISISIYSTTLERELHAFKVQQHMPIIKEEAEEMVPVAEKYAKSVTKGIKERLDNDKK